MHLLLPLLASLLFVCGLIFIKRAGAAGVGPWTITFLANQSAMLAFSSLWFWGGPGQPWSCLWQPAIIAWLYIQGLVFTFLAIGRGDVSVATPVFGLKVILVAFLLATMGGESLPRSVWYACLLATLGIGLIQWTGQGKRRNVAFTVLLALGAASSYASFDVLVQRWAPAWGAGRFLPLVYWMVGLLSLGLVPWVQWSKLREPAVLALLVPGALLIALQAVCIVVTLSVFGDAARVNVVYALRGLWAVVLAWAASKIWGGSEALLGPKAWLTRLLGAGFLTAAVILALRPA